MNTLCFDETPANPMGIRAIDFAECKYIRIVVAHETRIALSEHAEVCAVSFHYY